MFYYLFLLLILPLYAFDINDHIIPKDMGRQNVYPSEQRQPYGYPDDPTGYSVTTYNNKGLVYRTYTPTYGGYPSSYYGGYSPYGYSPYYYYEPFPQERLFDDPNWPNSQ